MAQSEKHWLCQHQGLNSGPGTQVKVPSGAVLASHSSAEEMGTSGVSWACSQPRLTGELQAGEGSCLKEGGWCS